MIKNLPKTLASILLLVILFLPGCKKNEFEVIFDLPENVNEVYTTLYYASDPEKGWLIEGVVSVQKGKGHLQGITREPTLLYISYSGSGIEGIAYVERGDKIHVTGSSASPGEWKISGNRLTESLSDWRIANKGLLEGLGRGSKEATDALNAAVAASVRKAPESPLSALLLGLYYNKRADRAGYAALEKLLKGDAAEPRWKELISRSDMIGDEAGAKMPKEIVLRSLFTGCDTVRFGKVPVMIVFGQSSDESYPEEMKQLRGLSEEIKDSAQRVIVNIGIDPDSLVTLSACRRDSLRSVVSAWAPMGVSDNVAVAMGVPRVPWEIVVGRDGKVKYEGDEMAEAIKAMKAACQRDTKDKKE